jgi:hypothetical protein
MRTMIDELFDRDYQAGRRALNADITKLAARFGAAFGNAFKVLNRIEYSEPWASKRNRARCN